MYTPKIIVPLFWIVAAAMLIATIVDAYKFGDADVIYNGVGIIIIWYVLCEVIVTVFRIHDEMMNTNAMISDLLDRTPARGFIVNNKDQNN